MAIRIDIRGKALLVAIGSSGAIVAAMPSPAIAAETVPQVLRIRASEFSFSPAVIRTVAGRPVRLVLDNSGGTTEHDVEIPALGVRIFAPAGEKSEKLVVFTQPGDYDFRCGLPGHAEAGMGGKLTVTSPDPAKRDP